MTPAFTVVIPVRKGGNADTTLTSLEAQTFKDFDVVVVHDREEKGAPWARNRGLEQVTTPLVLFSDDDICWRPTALDILKRTLDASPHAAYSYGDFTVGLRPRIFCPFSAAQLRKQNIVTTMSLVRRDRHPGWDESLKRLQDWDVYLTMLERGDVGVYCGRVLFDTPKKNGITHGGASYEDAERVVREKHGL